MPCDYSNKSKYIAIYFLEIWLIVDLKDALFKGMDFIPLFLLKTDIFISEAVVLFLFYIN